MIEGLKLTMTGLKLRAMLEERIRAYERHAAHARKELDAGDAKGIHQLPDNMLEGHIERDQRRIDTLTLIRDHVIHDEVYRLTEYDLEFGELLPPEEHEFYCPCCDHCSRI